MKINDLTIGQVKELTSLMTGDNAQSKSKLYECYVGKYVICRSYNEGVNAGKVLALDETGVVLEDARRLFYHKPADESLSWYEGVALSGLSRDSMISAPVNKVLVEDYSLTICTHEAEQSIRGAKTHGQ